MLGADVRMAEAIGIKGGTLEQGEEDAIQTLGTLMNGVAVGLGKIQTPGEIGWRNARVLEEERTGAITIVADAKEQVLDGGGFSAALAGVLGGRDDVAAETWRHAGPELHGGMICVIAMTCCLVPSLDVDST